ncbi:hypothetical protein RCL1_004935 [Eukaryota sp. TZLM3-RCL]
MVFSCIVRVNVGSSSSSKCVLINSSRFCLFFPSDFDASSNTALWTSFANSSPAAIDLKCSTFFIDDSIPLILRFAAPHLPYLKFKDIIDLHNFCLFALNLEQEFYNRQYFSYSVYSNAKVEIIENQTRKEKQKYHSIKLISTVNLPRAVMTCPDYLKTSVRNTLTNQKVAYLIDGSGYDGKNGRSTAGEDGESGQSFLIEIEPVSSRTFRLNGSVKSCVVLKEGEVCLIKSRGGNGGRGAPGIAGENGKDGVNPTRGLPGGNGCRGGKGGDAGSIILKARSTLDFLYFSIDLRPGEGGSGGKGGKGGRGGCLADSSIRLSDGVVGESGKNGDEGKFGSIIFQLFSGQSFSERFFLEILGFNVTCPSSDLILPNSIIEITNIKVRNNSKDMELPENSQVFTEFFENQYVKFVPKNFVTVPKLAPGEEIQLEGSIMAEILVNNFELVENFGPNFSSEILIELKSRLNDIDISATPSIQSIHPSRQMINVEFPVKFNNDFDFPTIISVDHESTLSFSLFNASTFDIIDDVIVEFDPINVSVSSILIDGQSIDNHDNRIQLPIKSKSNCEISVKFLGPENESKSSLKIIVTFKNFKIFTRNFDFTITTMSKVNPDILIVIDPHFNQSEIPVWINLFERLELSCIIHHIEEKQKLCRDDVIWVNNQKDGLSTFKLIFAPLTTLNLIDSFDCELFLWLINSNTSFLFLRGTYTNSIIYHKFLDDWIEKSPCRSIINDESWNVAGSIKSSVQLRGSKMSRVLSLPTNHPSILSRADVPIKKIGVKSYLSSFLNQSENQSFIASRVSQITSSIKIQCCLSTNQIGIDPSLKNLNKILPIIKKVNYVRPIILGNEDDDVITLTFQDFDSKFNNNWDLLSGLLQAPKNSLPSLYNSFAVDVINQKMIDLGPVMSSTKISVSSLFGFGLISIISVLNFEMKISLLRKFCDSNEELEFVFPGLFSMNILEIITSTIIFDLEKEAQSVTDTSAQSNLIEFQNLVLNCLSNNDLQSNFPTILYKICVEIFDNSGISEIITQSKANYSMIKTLLNLKNLAKNLMSNFPFEIVEKSKVLKFSVKNYSEIFGLDKYSRFPFFARHRWNSNNSEKNKNYCLNIEDQSKLLIL